MDPLSPETKPFSHDASASDPRPSSALRRARLAGLVRHGRLPNWALYIMGFLLIASGCLLYGEYRSRHLMLEAERSGLSAWAEIVKTEKIEKPIKLGRRYRSHLDYTYHATLRFSTKSGTVVETTRNVSHDLFNHILSYKSNSPDKYATTYENGAFTYRKKQGDPESRPVGKVPIRYLERYPEYYAIPFQGGAGFYNPGWKDAIFVMVLVGFLAFMVWKSLKAAAEKEGASPYRWRSWS